MKSSYDIILYFSWVHSSHIHKYFALKQELNKHASALLIFDNGKLGVTTDQIKVFEPFMEDVIVGDLRKASQIIFDYSPKILVLGSDKQTMPWQKQVSARLKSTTIQLPHLVGVDIYYANTSFLAVLGPVQKAINKKILATANVENKININPWLYDLYENCLPTNLTKEDFCKKYKLNPTKEILIWLPDMTSVSGPITGTKQQVLQRYKNTCELDNVIVKVHPNEFKRYKAERINNKWSYELAGINVPVLDPIDAHWAYKYCDCGIGDTTSSGLEFGFFSKPFIYLDHCAPQVNDGSHWDKVWLVDGKNYFSWVGHECRSDKLNEFIEKKQYKIHDKNAYKQHKEKFCENASKNGIEMLKETILKLI